MKEEKERRRFTAPELADWSMRLAWPVILVAICVLAGWIFDIPFLRQPFGLAVAMNPATAFSFLCSGIAVLLLDKGHFARTPAIILACIVCAVGLLKLAGTLLGFDPLIDSLLVDSVADLYPGVAPNRMAPNTALCLLLCGSSMLAMAIPNRRAVVVAQNFAVVALLLSLLSLLGYLYHVQAFYGFFSFTPMALHTAFCFFLLSISLLFFRAGEGFMSVFTGSHAGSIMARSFAPVAILLPAALGLLRISGEWMNLYETEFGTALFVISTICCFLVLIRFNAAEINRRDEAKDRAEEELRLLNAKLEELVAERTADLDSSRRIYRTIASSIPNSTISIIDRQERYILVEGDLVERFGYKKNEMVGSFVKDLATPEGYALVKEPMRRMFAGEFYSMEVSHRQPDLYMQFVPLFSESGKVDLGMMMTMDISELKKAQKEVQDLNRNLEERIRQRTEQLTAVNAELEAFSYSVSHDLRAPLRAVDGFAKMLSEDYSNKLDEEGNRLLNTIRYNAQRMGTLIDDLLAFSRTGKKDMKVSLVDMNELVPYIVDEISRNEPHKAEIVIGELEPVMADYALLSQVVTNLVSNAIKYSSKHEHPRLEIFSEKKDRDIIYHFRDNGVGFNMKYNDRLFGVFQRLHSADEFAGNGVGLAIVQRIVLRHNGRVWAESEPGKGAEFFVQLPATTELKQN